MHAAMAQRQDPRLFPISEVRMSGFPNGNEHVPYALRRRLLADFGRRILVTGMLPSVSLPSRKATQSASTSLGGRRCRPRIVQPSEIRCTVTCDVPVASTARDVELHDTALFPSGRLCVDANGKRSQKRGGQDFLHSHAGSSDCGLIVRSSPLVDQLRRCVAQGSTDTLMMTG